MPTAAPLLVHQGRESSRAGTCWSHRGGIRDSDCRADGIIDPALRDGDCWVREKKKRQGDWALRDGLVMFPDPTPSRWTDGFDSTPVGITC